MKQTIDVRVPAAVALTSNQRLHRYAQAEKTRQLRTLGRLAGRSMVHVPGSLRVKVDIAVWKGQGRRYDPANLYPTAKAVLDGMVDAGVLVDDDYRHVDGPHLHYGGVNPALRGRTRFGGHVVLTVTMETIGGAL